MRLVPVRGITLVAFSVCMVGRFPPCVGGYETALYLIHTARPSDGYPALYEVAGST